MKASRVSSNRETEMGVRKSGSGADNAGSGQPSMIYALTHKQPTMKDRTITYGQANAANNVAGGSGTPIRGASGSLRRKLVAQQGHQHFKKHLGGSSNTFRDGTPKERNNQIPQIGVQPSNRVKSSRGSERNVAAGHASTTAGTANQRAITPKQAQKLYQSINVNKNTRNSSHSKMANASEPYLTQSNAGAAGPNSYTQSMQNLGTGGRVATNASNMSNNQKNDYNTGQGGATIGQSMSSQLMGLGAGNGMGSNMAGMSLGLTKSSKIIPKKEWRDHHP